MHPVEIDLDVAVEDGSPENDDRTVDIGDTVDEFLRPAGVRGRIVGLTESAERSSQAR